MKTKKPTIKSSAAKSTAKAHSRQGQPAKLTDIERLAQSGGARRRFTKKTKSAAKRTAKPKPRQVQNSAQLLLPIIERLAESAERLAQAAEQLAEATLRPSQTPEPQHPTRVETPEVLADLTAPREPGADVTEPAVDMPNDDVTENEHE